MRKAVLFLGVVLVCSVAAQESTNYKLNEHTFNAGGNPSDGVVLSSPSYKITLDAIGDSVVQSGLSSSSYRIDGGFGSAYSPPGEVLRLRFTDEQTMVWDPERSAGVYNLYRGPVNGLDDSVYGFCVESGIATNTTTDSDPVPAGGGFFYLVTVENRLGEEGTKGWDSSDSVREGNVCP